MWIGADVLEEVRTRGSSSDTSVSDILGTTDLLDGLVWDDLEGAESGPVPAIIKR